MERKGAKKHKTSTRGTTKKKKMSTSRAQFEHQPSWPLVVVVLLAVVLVGGGAGG